MNKLCALIGAAALVGAVMPSTVHADANNVIILMDWNAGGANFLNSTFGISESPAQVAPPGSAGSDNVFVVSGGSFSNDRRTANGAIPPQVFNLSVKPEGSYAGPGTGTLRVWISANALNQLPADNSIIATLVWGGNVLNITNANTSEATASTIQNIATGSTGILTISPGGDPIPEPGSLLALGTGALSLAGLIRRRSV